MIDATRTLGSLPPAQAAELERAGPVWGSDINGFRDLVVRAYTPLVAAAPKDGISVARDLPYGDSPRQVLDIFQPSDAHEADVVVFVHGGAFIRGAKSFNGHIYDNVSYWFARHGLVAVNMEYRLAAEAPFPGGAEDVAAAVRWLAGHVGEFGGNPRRLFLIGHSAGGTHVATYCFDPRHGFRPDRGVRGAVLISARLQADVLPGNPNAKAVEAYFGSDTSRYEIDSPMAHAAESDLPVMVAIAQYENPYLDLYGLEFCRRLAQARGYVPRFMQLTRHNHTSIVAHFDSGEELLGREILDFFHGIG
ncbi:MAG: alpha/beta hydrolase [Pigmentiphaga sp.]|uniref:alpha/beta hydrolase n=1 Tax=Pigmentiphaga sp. TaxID=1977564 RepID=UPI0029B90FD0|nr:alpha/beta hydrolase [Pigmentiphaga sp.]MDX3904934.1 alpha/beta hydrolase [Pigmentiphaga sp.]